MQLSKIDYGCLIYTIIALGFIVAGTFHLNCNSNPDKTDKNEPAYLQNPEHISDKAGKSINPYQDFYRRFHTKISFSHPM